MKQLYKTVGLIAMAVVYIILNLWIVTTGWNMLVDTFLPLPHINMMHTFSLWCLTMLIRQFNKQESMNLREFALHIASNILTRLMYLGILYLALLNTGTL